MNAQEVQLNVALPKELFVYEPVAHASRLVAGSDARRVTGYQDSVDLCCAGSHLCGRSRANEARAGGATTALSRALAEAI
jgi:hypothetical protein